MPTFGMNMRSNGDAQYTIDGIGVTEENYERSCKAYGVINLSARKSVEPALNPVAIKLRPSICLTPIHQRLTHDWQCRVNICGRVFKSNWIARGKPEWGLSGKCIEIPEWLSPFIPSNMQPENQP